MVDRRLPCLRGMRTLLWLLTLLALPVPAGAQDASATPGALIATVQVGGIDTAMLSPGLRQDIDALTGTALDLARLRALAARIESELPDVVADASAVALPDGRARVVFEVSSLAKELEANINARYEVESVAIEGIAETRVSQSLRDDMQALVGSRLVPSDAERLRERLARELAGHEVRRRLSRGSGPGRIRLVYEVREGDPDVLTSGPKLVYHSTHAWSGALMLGWGKGPFRVSVPLVFGDEEGWVEERAGYGVRIESNRLGTERLGVSFELADHRQTWEPATLAALAADPRIPEAYRSRLWLEPALVVTPVPALRITAGVSISELESLSRSPSSQTASAATGSVRFRTEWDVESGARHTLAATYGVRAGTGALESDLVYTRHIADAQYAFEGGRSEVVATTTAGRLGGRAPLFERFTLGDSRTLRGWSKYDIAPAGAERMVHQSVEYRYRRFAVFVDVGSLWRPGGERRVRTSTGLGYRAGPAFLTLAFPLNAGELRAAFMMGIGL